jgi:hypothetical protein
LPETGVVFFLQNFTPRPQLGLTPLIVARMNGAKVLQAKDDSFPTGRVGFRNYADRGIPSDSTFSDLIIR